MVTRMAILGNRSSEIDAIVAQLVSDDIVVSHDDAVEAALIDAIDVFSAAAFADLTDADFDRHYVEPILRLDAAAAEALRRVRPGGCLIVVGSDAFLGQPEAAMQSAASGSVVNLVRTIALQDNDRRCNLLLLPFDPTNRDATVIADAARTVALLIAATSLNGERIMIDSGSHLRSLHVARR